MKKILAFIICLGICNVFADAQDFDCDNGKQSQENYDDTLAPVRDSLRIALLTCDGYDEVWALYGHSALRIQNVSRGEDYAVNYGLFDFHQPFFPLKFALGQCDYLMGLVPFPIFLQEFTAKGAGVFEQELNLTYEEKTYVLQAIAINNLPENREYRYNFYYDNCASRPRDIVLNNIPRKIRYTNEIDETQTYRQLIHSCNDEQRWCRFGNDILLGVGSDRPTTREEQQFLPENLKRDFASALLVDDAGQTAPLIASSQWILPRKTQPVEKGFPLSPLMCSALLFAVCCLLTFIEKRKEKRAKSIGIDLNAMGNGASDMGIGANATKGKRLFWVLDVALLTFAGVIGLLLFFMLFSEHPTVRLNLQILVFNPLLLLLLWKKRRPQIFRAYYVFCLAALAAGLVWQDFAEGVIAFILCLLLRLEPYIRNKKG